jgi:DNA-directed RNA polymerase subunit M
LDTADAQRIRKPKLPKKRLLKKPKKEKSKGSRAFDGGGSSEPEHKALRKGVKFCPKCGSINIFWASGLPQLWSIWECRNCGYRGALVLEDSRLAGKLREDYAKRGAK